MLRRLTLHLTISSLAAALASIALLASACGSCGAEQDPASAYAPKVIAVTEMTERQRSRLLELELIEEGEGIIWYYDPSPIGRASSANVLTNRRIGAYSGDEVSSLLLDDVESASHQQDEGSERIRVEGEGDEALLLEFGPSSDSERMYSALCERIKGHCEAE